MKYKIVILVLGVLVLVALVLFGIYKLQKNKVNCFITEEGIRKNCGVYQNSSDGQYSLYLARISGFFNKNSMLYVNLNFGMLNVPFPVGKIGRDQMNIVSQKELQTRDLQGQAFMNMVDIQSNTYQLLNEKYGGKITSIILLSDNGMEKRMKNNLENTDSQIVLSESEKEFVRDWLNLWDTCGGKVNESMATIGGNNYLSGIKEIIFDIVNPKYFKCRQFISSFIYYE